MCGGLLFSESQSFAQGVAQVVGLGVELRAVVANKSNMIGGAQCRIKGGLRADANAFCGRIVSGAGGQAAIHHAHFEPQYHGADRGRFTAGDRFLGAFQGSDHTCSSLCIRLQAVHKVAVVPQQGRAEKLCGDPQHTPFHAPRNRIQAFLQ